MKKETLLKFSGILQVAIGIVALVSLMAFTPGQQNAGDEWTLITSQNGISAYAMESNCDGQTKYLIRLENTSSDQKTFTITYFLEGSQAFGPITEKYVLNASDSKEGSCTSHKALVLPDFERKPGTVSDKVNIEITNQ